MLNLEVLTKTCIIIKCIEHLKVNPVETGGLSTSFEKNYCDCLIILLLATTNAFQLHSYCDHTHPGINRPRVIIALQRGGKMLQGAWLLSLLIHRPGACQSALGGKRVEEGGTKMICCNPQNESNIICKQPRLGK